jgi:hypothetical protein
VSRARVLAATILTLGACAIAPPPATAEIPPTVSLRAAFTPERLGAGTTMTFGFTIKTPVGQAPSPLTDISLLYPANLGLFASGLGLAVCHPERLEILGLPGCPDDSLMGYGEAFVDVPVEPEPVHESASITVLLGPAENNHLGLLFYAYGISPILAQLIFPGLLLTAPAPYGGNLETHLPLLESFPEGPDVSVTSLHATIGPSHITYYANTNGHRIAFHPNGILLPRYCPHGGFPFAAHFTFQNNTHATAQTAVPCPPNKEVSR